MNLPDPRETLLRAPLSGYQRAAISVTVGLCALDGFDVLAVTYAAPGFLTEWNLSRAELGFALSMGIVGMATGSFLLAPVADILGRRRTIFVCLLLMAGGMTATAFTHSLSGLCAWRVITGLGIGAMLSVINPLVAEYSNAFRRDLSIGLMAVGFPIGGTLGGLAAAMLLEAYDWRAIFLFGGALAMVMFPIVMYWILEPVGFLIDKPTDESLKKVNQFLSRCGLATVDQLPAPAEQRHKLPFKEIFDRDNLKTTVHLTVLFGAYMVSVYFFLSWTPQIVADLGLDPAVAVTVAVTRDLAGILGGALLGWLAHYLDLKRLTLMVVASMGLAVILFGQISADIMALKAAAALGGFCLYSGMVGLMAIIARTFPTRVRASGAGFVIGVGRVSGAMAPILGGYLFTLGMDRSEVTFAMSVFALLAATLLFFFHVKPITAD